MKSSIKNSVKLGAKLEELRKNKNYSQEYVANKCGIGRATLWNIEHGKGNITDKNLKNLCFLYNVAVEDIYEDQEETEEDLIPVIDEEPEAQPAPQRKWAETHQVISFLSMITGKGEAQIMAEAIQKYAETIDVRKIIKERFNMEV